VDECDVQFCAVDVEANKVGGFVGAVVVKEDVEGGGLLEVG
jgi:hypothetical protein